MIKKLSREKKQNKLLELHEHTLTYTNMQCICEKGKRKKNVND